MNLLCFLRLGDVVFLRWFDKNYGIQGAGYFTDEKLWPMKENIFQVFVGSLKDAKFRLDP